MKNKKEENNPFQSYRWHEDVGAKVVRHEESSKEEREAAKKEFDKILTDWVMYMGRNCPLM